MHGQPFARMTLERWASNRSLTRKPDNSVTGRGFFGTCILLAPFLPLLEIVRILPRVLAIRRNFFTGSPISSEKKTNGLVEFIVRVRSLIYIHTNAPKLPQGLKPTAVPVSARVSAEARYVMQVIRVPATGHQGMMICLRLHPGATDWLPDKNGSIDWGAWR